MYYATIMGIDPTYYEAATVDGASKWQRIRNVTIPQLTPLVTVLTILAVGNISVQTSVFLPNPSQRWSAL